MKIHPIAGLLPKMSASDFIALKSDIKSRGIVEPVWTKNKKIIDGRHRWRACQELKAEGVEIECPTREFAGDDVLTFVISANVMRRHLSGQQKRAIVKKLLKARPEQTNRNLAKTANVNDHMIAEVRAELEAVAQIPQLPKRVGKDGKAYQARKPAAVTSVCDLQARRLLKALDAIHPNELTDAREFINELSTQLNRLQALIQNSVATKNF